MNETSYIQRRGEIEAYFDQTALESWKKLTGEQPVSGIRATVRAGRDEMRKTLLSYLPDDLHGWRVLDAGCGSGVMAFELAARGADVLGIDLSPQMIGFARQKQEAMGIPVSSLCGKGGSVRLEAGDMLAEQHGNFDAIVSMDALIHYAAKDCEDALQRFAERTGKQIVFTVAPKTVPLMMMLGVGKILPRSDRSPALYPVDHKKLVSRLLQRSAMTDWSAGRTRRVSGGFYTSQAVEVTRS